MVDQSQHSNSEDTELDMKRAQTAIEFGLGAVVPSILAIMLFSYVFFEIFVEVLLVLAVVITMAMILPAKEIHDLYFERWYNYTLPLKLINGLMGMIYISAVSVFTVAMVSVYEGLKPDNPFTFVIMACLLLILIVLLAYSAKNKARFLSTKKRYYKRDPRMVENRLREMLSEREVHYTSYPGNGRWKIDLEEREMSVDISPLRNNNAEVSIEGVTAENEDLFEAIKDHLDS